MHTCQNLSLLIFILFTVTHSFAQRRQIITDDHPIYQLESQLMQGNKSALNKIAQYFDSKKEVVEFLGHHQMETTESEIAQRIVKENTLFTNEEFVVTDSSSTRQFIDFLDKNNDKISFSTVADAFLLTPLADRQLTFEIKEISDIRKQELKNNESTLLSYDWVKENKIDSLIQARNPLCLLLIASELFKSRSRYNRYNFNEEEYTSLLQYLTCTVIGVENISGNISYHVEKDFDPKSKLNLLIYFSKFYSVYFWDKTSNVFVNPNQTVKHLEKEEILFDLLNNKNDSIALDAFIQLTTCNPKKVTELADEYETARMDLSYILPTFPTGFLKQLVLLTNYCKQNNIDFTCNKELQKNISLLNSKLSFPERRALEDKMIRTLTLDEITAFEYWVMINEKRWRLTYSAGRIIDIFYSKHFSEILNNEKHLTLYLEKSALFDNLGIIGICNYYLIKFTNLQGYGIEKLAGVQASDSIIRNQVEKAKGICKTSIHKPHDDKKFNEANKDYDVKNLKQEIAAIRKIKNQEKKEYALVELLSKINYDQIGEAMEEIEHFKFSKNEWKKYSFLDRDFGFFYYSNFEEGTIRKQFLNDYKKYSEFDFYKNMLTKSGFNYFNADNTLNYDIIYDALKFNIVEAFVGGGGGRDDNEVYAIIKLLELTHNTSLGYPKKLCNSNGTYGCDSQDRTSYWMEYLREQKLLKFEHNEPVSLHYK